MLNTNAPKTDNTHNVNEKSTPNNPRKNALITKQSKNWSIFEHQNSNKRPKNMTLFDPDEYPMHKSRVAALCGVCERTAERWIKGTTKAPTAARKLVQLVQRERIMPDSWPHSWRINSAGALDIGHPKIALTSKQIAWYFDSIAYNRALLDTVRDIERRLAALPRAVVIDFAEQVEKMRKLSERPFALSPYEYGV